MLNGTCKCFLGDMHIAALNETILLVMRFKIAGSLRFLSHAETVRVFQRACVRAGIRVRYSQGFNPRPRLSLPLPRPVGVESADELLCLRVAGGPWSVHPGRDERRATIHKERIKAELSTQLPEGCELLSLSIAEANRSFRPCSATYVLVVWPEYVNDRLKATVARLLASDTLNVRRQTAPKNSRPKTQNSKPKDVDVRGFLKSIELGDETVTVECTISSDGAIRVEEILNLLDLDVEKLAAPIRRTRVQWQVSES